MSRYLLAMFFICSVSCTFNDTDTLQSESSSETEVKKLLELAEQTKDEDPDEALVIAESALQKSIEIAYRSGEKKAHAFLSGVYAVYFRDHDKATFHQQKFYEVAIALNEHIDLAIFQYNQGYLHYENQNYQKALIHFFEAHDIYQKNQKPGKVGQALYGIAMSLFQEGLYEKALQYAIKIDMHEVPLPFQIKVAHMIGIVHYKMGTYTQSEKYLSQAVRIAEDISQAEMAAEHRLDLALAQIQQQKYDEARLSIYKVEDAARKLDRPYLRAQAYWKEGFMYENKAQYKEAAGHYRLGANLFAEIGEDDHLFSLQSNMVNAYTRSGELELAMKAGKAGLEYLEKASLTDQRRFLNNMSQMYLQANDSLQYYHYQNKAVTVEAEIISQDKQTESLEVETSYRDRFDVRELEMHLSRNQVLAEQARLKQYAIIGGIVLGVLVLVVILVNAIPIRRHERQMSQTHRLMVSIMDSFDKRMKGLSTIFPVTARIRPDEGPDEADLHNLHNPDK
ncbi:tetratricopeptide repeat protein [Roseivirga sp. BDSF3-8]|uniref:tetratricopeptide repeat protein n=1 Tax=Roseivirga sp. BDSF3-8 TaxID=3241598 RepID=UPI0035321FC6